MLGYTHFRHRCTVHSVCCKSPCDRESPSQNCLSAARVRLFADGFALRRVTHGEKARRRRRGVKGDVVIPELILAGGQLTLGDEA